MSIAKDNMRLSPRIISTNPVNGHTTIRLPSMVADWFIQLLNTYGQRSDYFSCCPTCSHWANGCKLANGAMPPPEVIANGCSSYEDIIPF